MTASDTTTLTAPELRQQACRHREPEERLDDEAVRVQLSALPAWRHADGALRRRYTFANYYETLAFVNALAWIAHQTDHHPELVVGYDRVDVAFDTHSAGGISLNDFICAARTDALLPA